MGFLDKAKAVKAAIVVAKVESDLAKRGHNPDDYAKFDTDEKKTKENNNDD